MNRTRRITLSEARQLLEKARDIVEEVCEEENEAMENMPENLQGSERYSAMENTVDLLSGVIGSIDEALDGIDEATA